MLHTVQHQERMALMLFSLHKFVQTLSRYWWWTMERL